MQKWKWWIMGVVFLIALGARFYNFKETIYFGYDEAVDWYRSQEIYINHDLKIQGMPATGNLGIFHGPLSWYLIGPMYALVGWDIEKFQIIMRVFNSMMVWPIYIIAATIASPIAGIMAGLIFATSFSAVQFAYFVGNPTFGLYAWIIIGLGVVAILSKKYRNWGPILLLIGAGLATQANLLLFYVNAAVIIILWILRDRIGKIGKKFWAGAVFFWMALVSSFLMAEMKYGFRNIKTLWMMKQNGWGVTSSGESWIGMYGQKYADLFKDSLGAGIKINWLWIGIGLGLTIFLIKKTKENVWAKVLLVWLYSWIILAAVFMHNGYYTHIGLGVAVAITAGWIVNEFWNKGKYKLVLGGLLIMVVANLWVVANQSNKSLISGIKPQPDVKYEDMKRIMDYWYTEAAGNNFTVRMVGIPYKVQTLWAAVLTNYGQKKYGYSPIWELGNIEVFPGRLPVPTKGTTCVRFFTREPMRGLPLEIIEGERSEEELFSTVTETKEFGSYLVEKRNAWAKDCVATPPQQSSRKSCPSNRKNDSGREWWGR